MNSIIQEPSPPQSEATSWSPDIEFIDCCIGGYRFGISTSYVRHSDVWRSDDLDPIPRTPIGVVGQTRWGGRWLPVIDLRELFCPHTAPDRSDAQMFLVTEDHDVGLILLVDGLIDIRCEPRTAFKSFTSLYVSDVRWLSGALIFDEAVVPMLDMQALSAYSQGDMNRHESLGEAFLTAHSFKGEP